jgi:poly(glycerol-phosphate) alpha-glucosyltransferase
VLGYRFPAGRYFTAPVDIPLDSGGQTRALLMRNRLFVSHAGIAPTVLTFGAYEDFEGRRHELLERGLLVPEIATANIYDHYRSVGWSPSDARAPAPLSDLSPYKQREDERADGTLLRTLYQPPGQTPVYDYFRADGSVFLRIPQFRFRDRKDWPTEIQRVDEAGQLVGSFGSLREWFGRFLLDLSAGERSFVFVDSRYNVQHLVPPPGEHVHVLYQIHNIHLEPPRHWSSPHPEFYDRALSRADDLDALVCLTRRQRDDIARRRGESNNLFVVPNPVEAPHHEGPLPPRDPHLVALVARLEPQKRIKHALDAFLIALDKVPDARFHIYGDGSRRQFLAGEIERLGVADRVVLKGHDPQARDALWTASAFLVTSAFEGWNLALQEGLSRGCPVVSYDVKYGPREQITDGVNGFLVPDGDVETMAARLVELLESPDLVRRLSAAAVERTSRSTEEFMQAWQQVLDAVVEQAPRRTRLLDVTLDDVEVDNPSRGGAARALSRLGRRATGRPQDPDVVRLRARVVVRGEAGESSGPVRLSLAAVHMPSGHYAELPLTVRREDPASFGIESTFGVRDAVDGAPTGAAVGLRVQLVWENSTWQQVVDLPGVRHGRARSNEGTTRPVQPKALADG